MTPTGGTPDRLQQLAMKTITARYRHNILVIAVTRLRTAIDTMSDNVVDEAATSTDAE